MSKTTEGDHCLRAMKARQARKIEQLREVFLTNGRLSVREQAELLGQHGSCRPAPQLQKFWALRSDHQTHAGVPEPTRESADYHTRIQR